MFDLSVSVSLVTGVNISPVVYGSTELAHAQAIGVPLMRNVTADGIVLLGRRVTVPDGQPQEVAKEYLTAAHGRLHSAEVLIEAGEYRDAISRAYYICLDVADAAVAVLGFTPRSHAGTIQLFHRHVVKPGLIETRFGLWLGRIERARLEADYDRRRMFTEDEAARALTMAREFVVTVEALIGKLRNEESGYEP